MASANNWSAFMQHISSNKATSVPAKPCIFVTNSSVSQLARLQTSSSSNVWLTSPVQPCTAGKHSDKARFVAASVAAAFSLPTLEECPAQQQRVHRPKLSAALWPLVLKTMALRDAKHHSGVKKSVKKVLRIGNKRGLNAGLRLGGAYCDKLVERDLHQPSLLGNQQTVKTAPIPNVGYRFLGGAKFVSPGLTRFGSSAAAATCFGVAAAAATHTTVVPAAVPVVCSQVVVLKASSASDRPVASRTRAQTRCVARRTRSKCRLN